MRSARPGVSAFTVKRHVANILTKLDLPTRAAAAAHATREGWVTWRRMAGTTSPVAWSLHQLPVGGEPVAHG